jgi:hypothetical protein
MREIATENFKVPLFDTFQFEEEIVKEFVNRISNAINEWLSSRPPQKATLVSFMEQAL